MPDHKPIDASNVTSIPIRVDMLPVNHNRDGFLTTLVASLGKTLQDVAGLDEATDFISLVGNKIGNKINDDYLNAANVKAFTLDEVGEILTDLKKRIGGDFSVVATDTKRIVLNNTQCPFGNSVIGNDSLCMMTSNVFGRITANNLGYARVELDKTIAKGDGQCKVIVHLQQDNSLDTTSRQIVEREYYAAAKSE